MPPRTRRPRNASQSDSSRVRFRRLARRRPGGPEHGPVDRRRVGGHAGLVRVLEFGRPSLGQPFAVVEFVEGRLLSDIMSASRALDIGRARRWAVGLGEAVEALHNVGLVHGRLRPRNVMVPPDGRVKLMDVEVTGLLGTPVLGACSI